MSGRCSIVSRASLVASDTGEPAADQPNVASEPKTQQDGAMTAAEPEVVASGWRTGGRRCTERSPATEKATGTKKAPTVDQKQAYSAPFFTTWTTFITTWTTFGTIFYHLGTVSTICDPRFS
jgi:hypothetical protein